MATLEIKRFVLPFTEGLNKHVIGAPKTMHPIKTLKNLNSDQRNIIYAYLSALLIALIQHVLLCDSFGFSTIGFLLFFSIVMRGFFATRNTSDIVTKDGIKYLRFNNGRIITFSCYATYFKLTKWLSIGLGLGTFLIYAKLGYVSSDYVSLLVTLSYVTFLNGYLLIKDLPALNWGFEPVNARTQTDYHVKKSMASHSDKRFLKQLREPGYSSLSSNIHHKSYHHHY